MNHKVLVDVYVPSIDESYHIYIPLFRKAGDIELMIAKAIMELSNGNYQIGTNPMLCSRESGNNLDKSKTIYDLQIDNGFKLMLI